MHKILLAVRVVEDGELTNAYCRELELPFVPAVGMRFEQGISTTLWETTTDDELDPQVERVIYDFDESTLVCLFTVSKPLAASFWTTVPEPQGGTVCAIRRYFRHCPTS